MTWRPDLRLFFFFSNLISPQHTPMQVLNCKLQLRINSYAAKSAADMATLLNVCDGRCALRQDPLPLGKTLTLDSLHPATQGGDGVIVGSDKPAVMAMEPWQILIYDAYCRTED